VVHQGGFWSPWSSWSTLIHLDPHFRLNFQKCGAERIRVDQVDHGDHDPPWWTRSVQDHLGPRSDISLMDLARLSIHKQTDTPNEPMPYWNNTYEHTATINRTTGVVTYQLQNSHTTTYIKRPSGTPPSLHITESPPNTR